MEKVEAYHKSRILNIVFGLFFSCIITVISFLIFGTILSVTNLSESTINPVIIIITSVSILISSSITCIKLEKKGMLTGGMIGGLYILILYVLSSILSKNYEVNLYSIIMMTLAIICGMIGGAIGINLK